MRASNSVAEFKDYLTKLVAERQQSPGTDGREILSIADQCQRICCRFGRARRRAPVGARASPQLHLPAQRRARDDDQSDRQQRRLAITVSRSTRRAAPTSGPHRHGDRGVSAHGKSQPARKPPRGARHRARRRRHCRPALTSIFVSAPPIATRRNFTDPDRLDIRRSPNRHLAFGLGIHACAGMSLARMEARIAIGKLVQRFPTIERVRDFVRGGRARFRGFFFSGRVRA